MEIKPLFSQVESDYIATECDIESIYYDIANEADINGSDPVETNPRKEGLLIRFRKTIEKTIEIIKGMIEKAIIRANNFFTKLAQTDEGFKKNCRTAMVKNKPYEAVKLIVYNYDDSFLDTSVNSVTNKIVNKILSLKTDYVSSSKEETNEMDSDKDKLIESIFVDAGISDVTNIGSYFSYIKKKYRKEKVEMLFKASQAKEYYNITMSYDKFKNTIQAKQRILSQQAAIVHKNLKNITNNKMAEEKIKYKVLNRYKNVTHLFNLYLHVLDGYLQLKTEKILMYRTVLKKIYHF